MEEKSSIIALSYTESDLIPPGRPRSPFNAKTLKLAHSIDGLNWTILPTSVVDTTNKTVAALHKISGFYPIVASPILNQAENTATKLLTSPTVLGEANEYDQQLKPVATPIPIQKKQEETVFMPQQHLKRSQSIIEKIKEFVKIHFGRTK